MKYTFLFLSILIISCSNIEKKDQKLVENIIKKPILENKVLIKRELTFVEAKDSLREVLLKSKPNENLKSSILQELYIIGLVNQKEDKIEFELPFNLHGFGCGAPDCYSTDIKFNIPMNKPIVFPEKVKFKIVTHGCGIEREIRGNGIFELVEQTSKDVNYYSKKHKSNLFILGEKRNLYYFPDTKPNSIKIDLIEKLFEEYDELNTRFSEPYQSTMMTRFYTDLLDKIR